MTGQAVATTCPYCGVGCGLRISATATRAVTVQGDESHPANYGRFCSKGAALAETLDPQHAPNRLTAPLINGAAGSWRQAIDLIAKRIQEVKAEHGANAIAFYLSGQLLTEDYYVANKLMKGFVGSANVDTNSRLCMSSAVAAYKRAFGADTVPCDYQDLEHADLLVFVGSNAAWTHPVLFQRMLAAKQCRPEVKWVVIDPRETPTAQAADLHLKIRPSSDGFVFQGLFNFLVTTDALDKAYIDANTEGFDECKAACSTLTMPRLASLTGVDESSLTTFYTWFAKTRKTVSFYSQGINQSATGTDKANAIINCHLATGKLGFQGAGPFSITGQPNAMGGREVGGLANMLAAHMDFDEASCDRVQRFWQSPIIAQQAGLKAVDLFKAMHRGEIKFVWIMATNPAVSLPDSDFVQAALARCQTVVVSDVCHTDTTRFADVVLPALAWGEKDGTVSNSERCISRQRAFQAAPGLAKPDWQIVTDVAHALGYAAQFAYRSARDVFVEHAALSSFENTEHQQLRDFDIGALANLSSPQYDALQACQWPLPEGGAAKRLFSDGRFYTASSKAQFVAIKPELAEPVRNKKARSGYLLNSGRSRDQWHTMTRTGYAPSLTSHTDLPELSMHVNDARRSAFADQQIVQIDSDSGSAIAQLRLGTLVRPGELFLPMHWSRQFAQLGVVNALVQARLDPVSGQPEFKTTAVDVQAIDGMTWCKLISSQRIEKHPSFTVWNVHYVGGAWVSLVAFKRHANDDHQHPERGELQLCIDTVLPKQSGFRLKQSFYNPLKRLTVGVVDDEQGVAAIIAKSDTSENLPSGVWFARTHSSSDCAASLRGERGYEQLICACFSISQNQVFEMITGGSVTLEEMAAKTGCGAKCGSCRPELRALIKQHAKQDA